MVAINQEQLLGRFIPDVYISKITLESTGVSLLEDNPHIDHERENLSRINRKKDSDGLVVTLDLILKEQLDNDLVGTWLGNQEIEKYLRIRVAQVTDPAITEVLSYGSDAIEMLQPGISVSADDMRTKLMAASLGVTSVQEIYERIGFRTKYREINVKKDIALDGSSLNQFKVRVDEDGNRVYDISYQMRFELADSNPEHLAYFAVTSFDAVKMAQDYSLELDTLELRETNGKVASDVVVDNYRVVARSFVFYDEAGQIWSGPVHELPNGQWRSGSEEDENSIDLERFTVTNAKVQDFRDVKEVERLMIDFSSIQNNLLNKNVTKVLSNYNPEPDKKTNFFSDMFIARDKDGDAKFFFTVDFEKMMEENAVFGKLIKGMPLRSRFKDEILRRAHIRSMRIVRRRIRPNSSSTRLEAPDGVTVFDRNEPDEVIVNSSEKEWRAFSRINNDNGSLREVDIFAGEEFEGIRHFTGMDKTMSDVTDGIYQYGVEVEIDDATVAFMEEKIQELIDAKAELEQYYNIGSQPSMSRYLAEIRDPHIDHPGEFAGTQGKSSGTYDPVSNRFTQHFIEMMRAKYSGRNIINAPWVSAIGVYVNVLDIFTNVFSSNQNRTKILNSLYSYTSPDTGNPNGVSTVMKLIDTLTTTLASIIGVTLTTSPRRWDGTNISRLQSPIVSSGRTSKKSFKVVKYFNQTFDSDVVKNSGVDYLSQGEDDTQNDDGIRVMPEDNMLRRADLETLKFFNDKEPDLNLSIGGKGFTSNDTVDNSKLSYFSPTRVDFSNRSVVLVETGGLVPKTDENPPKSKVVRNVTNINDGIVAKEDNALQITSALLYQNSITSPGNCTINRSISSGLGKGTRANISRKKGDEAKISKDTTNKTLSNFLSQQMGSTIAPVRVSLVEDADDDTFSLQDIQIVRRFPEISIECQVPDPATDLDASTQDEGEQDETDIEFEGVNGFLGVITGPAVQSGVSNIRDLTRRPNLTTTNALSKGLEPSTAISVKPSNAVSSVRKRQFSSTVKNLDSNQLTVSSMRNSPEVKSLQGLKNPIQEAEFKQYPNQIKAVFLKGSGRSSVRPDKIRAISEAREAAFENVKRAAELSLDYEMIMKVEYLSGFRRGEEGDSLVKEPVWTLLTPQVNNLIAGKQVLCRLRGYENPVLGIKKNKGLESGVYDQYFLYVPKVVDLGIRTLPEPPTIVSPGRFIDDFIDNISEIFPGLVIEPRPVDEGRSGILEPIQTRPEINLGNVPVSISVRGTTDDGESFIRDVDFTRPDLSSIINVFNNDTETTNNNRVVSLPINIATELVAMDCQTKNVETETTTTIVTPAQPVEQVIEEELSVTVGAEDSIKPEEECKSPLEQMRENQREDSSIRLTTEERAAALESRGDRELSVNTGPIRTIRQQINVDTALDFS